MLFNSVEFLIFLPVTFVIYWLIKDQQKLQNWFLLAISYLFYGWWDYRFLGLIVFSSIVDYLLGNEISKTVEQRKRQVGVIQFFVL